MFFKMLSADRVRLFRRPVWRNTLILLCLTPLLVNVIFFFVSRGCCGANELIEQEMSDVIVWPSGLQSSLAIDVGVVVGMVLVLIITALSATRSYRDRTIQNWIMRGIHRPQIIISKFANILLALLIIVLIPTLISGGFTALVAFIRDGAIETSSIEWEYLFRNYLANVYTPLPYIALTFLIAIATRSAVAAIGFILTFMLLIESAIVGILTNFFSERVAEFAQYLPGSLTSSLITWANEAIDTTDDLSQAILEVGHLTPWWAAIVIALYTAVFLSLAILIFRRQDLGG